MIKFLKIILTVYLIAYVFFSCSSSRESFEEGSMQKSLAEETSDELEQSFEKDSLSEEDLTVFQHRARQKVEDFISYLEIVSNKTIDYELRLEAVRQIEEIFTDTGSSLNIALFEEEKKQRSLSGFLNELLNSAYDSLKIKTDSIVTNRVQRDVNGNYVGKIGASVNLKAYKDNLLILESFQSCEAGSLIKKTEKSFGDEKKMIWSVKINEIR